ncbi:unnamed protein product, partial [Meganyctiphanes norvegica]
MELYLKLYMFSLKVMHKLCSSIRIINSLVCPFVPHMNYYHDGSINNHTRSSPVNKSGPKGQPRIYRRPKAAKGQPKIVGQIVQPQLTGYSQYLQGSTFFPWALYTGQNRSGLQNIYDFHPYGKFATSPKQWFLTIHGLHAAHILPIQKGHICLYRTLEDIKTIRTYSLEIIGRPKADNNQYYYLRLEKPYKTPPRLRGYLTKHIKGQATCCRAIVGTWNEENLSELCDPTEKETCMFQPAPDARANSSLLYRTDIKEMHGFCDDFTHDPDSPTPHNLLCGGKSVWEIIAIHPDFGTTKTQNEILNERFISEKFEKLPGLRGKENGETIERNDYKKDISTSNAQNKRKIIQHIPNSEFPNVIQKSTRTENVEIDISSLKNLEKSENRTLFRNISKLIESSSPINKNKHVSRKRREKEAFLTKIPQKSLVGPHINHSKGTFPLEGSKDELQGDIKPPDFIIGDIVWPFLSPEDLPNADNVIIGSSSVTNNSNNLSPPSPDVTFLSPAPNVVILALDLSHYAITMVDVDMLRGGILRWLWGLAGAAMQVAVVAVYNNDSFPISLGPLQDAPTTASDLEDMLALLPSQIEVDTGAYGGLFCLTCVIDQTTKMLQDEGLNPEVGVLLLAACQPDITPEEAATAATAAATSGLTIHILSLCPTNSLNLDLLAPAGGVWYLPGISGELHTASSGGSSSKIEQTVSETLISATRATLWVPGDHSLVRIAGVKSEIESNDVFKVGPYISVTNKINLGAAKQNLLIIMSLKHHAKVVEVLDAQGSEIDMIRDTNQRFWTIMDNNRGDITYTLKFLNSSVTFPLPINIDIYERKKEDEEDLQIKLFTNNERNAPLDPSSTPLIIWAEVKKGGLPIVGAEVMLNVAYLGQDKFSDMIIQLLDNGNAEPDVRSHDGVYSRYVTGFQVKGRYSLTATASDNHGAASVLLNGPNGDIPVTTGHFFISSPASSVIVSQVSSHDHLPPSRVTDLSVRFLEDTKTVNLTWTSPGGDLDYGRADFYELKMYTERSVFSSDRFDSSTISVYCIKGNLQTPAQNPSLYGTPEHCVTEIPFSNIRWYFGIRAVDASNNSGQVSNIVSVFIPELTTTQPPPSTSTSSSTVQTVLMVTFTTTQEPKKNKIENITSPGLEDTLSDWQIWMAASIAVGAVILLVLFMMICVCCYRRRDKSKDPDRPIYKIYVNNAYIQEEDGEIKVVSNGKLVDDKDSREVPPVQEWVNSLSKYASDGGVYTGDPDDSSPTQNDLGLLEERGPQSSVKYPSPVRFGVLTNGSIMRDIIASSSSTSSKPSDESTPEDFKYRDLSETNSSNSTSDGTASATSTTTNDLPPPLPLLTEGPPGIPLPHIRSVLPPIPPPKPKTMIPGPTIVSIHNDLNNEYTSDEDGGFRTRTIPGPGPRKYIPNHFSSFRYLPPPPEYGSSIQRGPIDYPLYHTVSRATGTLPHGTVRSVKKRRHISFV